MHVFGLFALLLPTTLLGQGTFKSADGSEFRWSINPNHVLLWNAAPYLPFGLRIGASESEIAAAKAAGFEDVLVDCPPQPNLMRTTVEALERNGMRYMLSVDRLAPTARGVLIEPQGNRITGITAKQTLDFKISGAEEALVVLAVRRDGYVQSTQRVKSLNGSFSVTVSPPNDLEHMAVIYPITANLARLAVWDSFDSHRDALLTSLKKAGLGKGFRGLVNPLGTLVHQSGARSFVPTGRIFRMEFAAYLRQRYRSPQTAMRSWAMGGSDEKTFEQLAALVPLWNGSRGVSSLWDPAQDELLPCEMRRSSIWRDLDTLISTAEARRTERLIASIRRVADVPIVQEWSGWSPLYEGSSHGLDGLAGQPTGPSLSSIAASGAGVVSSLLRWPKSGWLLATQFDPGRDSEALSSLPGSLDDVLSLGFRGAFVRTKDSAVVRALAPLAQAKSIELGLAQWTIRPYYYPESALNPANSMRLPGGGWWLPSPGGGTRVPLGSQFFGYRQDAGTGPSFALWSRTGRARVKLELTAPQGVQFTTVDGTDPRPKPVRGGIEVEVSELPLIISGVAEMPVPLPAFEEATARFAALIAEADRRLMDTTEERFLFRDHLTGYPRNPGGNFLLLQNIIQRLSAKVARFLWIEAESSRENNFSDLVSIPGVSGGNALGLKTQLVTTVGEYAADYVVQPRTDEEVECWVAARLTKSERDAMAITLGGQTLTVEGEPVSAYGPGFAWHFLGKTRMGRTQTKFVLKILAPEGADLAIDAIVFYPGSFRPDGVFPPPAVPLGASVRPPGSSNALK